MTLRRVRRAMIAWFALATSLIAGAGSSSLPAFGHPSTTARVASGVPSSGLVDGSNVTVTLTGATPNSVWNVVDCGPNALNFYLNGKAPSQDGCEQRSTWMLAVDAAGVGVVTISARAVLTTAAGRVDCRVSKCFVALEEWTNLDHSGLKLVNLSFASSACEAPGSCQSAPDAWDPALGGIGYVTGPAAGVSPAGSATSVLPADPGTFPVSLSAALPLGPGGEAPGPVSGALPSSGAAVPPSGEGILHLAMSAPGTQWGPVLASSVVADVTLTDLTTGHSRPTQQVVLHAGSEAFDYTSFVGSIVSSDHYSVSIAVERSARVGGLSQVPKNQVPQILVIQVALHVIASSSPDAMLERYAPVVYGRSTSALHDTPLILDGTAVAGPAGSTTLSYTMIWSHEDAGTAFVPMLEWSRWGRLTDIESFMTETLDASGKVTAATYFWGGIPSSGYADSDGALQEVTKTFPLSGAGLWWGTHPIVRDATGNNDFVAGTSSPFRFQLDVVPGPTGTRESIMDAYPFSYRVMASEIPRWYSNVDTNPSSPLTGLGSQYAFVDVATASTDPSAQLAVSLELGGHWYSSDLGWGATMVGTGHLRTTVKLPLGWTADQVQAARVSVLTPTLPSSVTVSSFTIERLGSDGSLTTLAPLVPSVVAEVPSVGPALSISSIRTVYSAATHRTSVWVQVLDAFGAPAAGITVTTTLSGGAHVPGCPTCTSISLVTGPAGSASTQTAEPTTGSPKATVSVVDSAVARQTADLHLTN